MSDDILEDVLASAEARADLALHAIRRSLFGDEAYRRARVDEAMGDARARRDPPPDPSVRRRLIPLWGWRKRTRG